MGHVTLPLVRPLENGRSRLSRLFGRRGPAKREAELAAELQYLERVLASQPDDYLAYLQAGIVSGLLGDHDLAKAYLQQAVGLNPEDSLAWGNLGMAFGNSGDHFSASYCFAQALHLNPRDRKARAGKKAAMNWMEGLHRAVGT